MTWLLRWQLQLKTWSKSKKKSKAIPVIGRGGLLGCEVLRIPNCLDNRLTDGGKVVSPTHLPHFTIQKHYYFYVSGTRFCYRLSKPQDLVRPEGLRKFKKKITSHHITKMMIRFYTHSTASCCLLLIKNPAPWSQSKLKVWAKTRARANESFKIPMPYNAI
jgi:hypothetical protein